MNQLFFIDAFSYVSSSIFQLRDITELAHCKGWRNLRHLRLDGNSIARGYSDAAGYQAAVRKFFPNLETLDGEPMAKVITFDGEDEAAGVSLPPAVKQLSVGTPEQVRQGYLFC